jgi:CBS-domain-containing membrane protein
MSTPVLLGRFEERKVVSTVTAINGALAILTIGLFAWLTDLPLMFPALGPSAFILFSAPLSPAAAPRNVVLGHLTSLASGWGIWHLMGALSGEVVSTEVGGWPLFCGTSLTLGISGLLMIRMSCPHPPACASGMIVALGGVTGWYDVAFMAAAVVWLTIQAVGMNRLAGLPVPTWKPRRLEPVRE